MCLYAYRSRPKRRGESVVFYPARPSVRARARVTTPSSGGVECRFPPCAGWPFGVCASASTHGTNIIQIENEFKVSDIIDEDNIKDKS
ncbi:DNA polymerase alpha subunit B, partial [Aphis craccivora]